MVKLFISVLSSLCLSSAAFAPQTSVVRSTAINAFGGPVTGFEEVGGEVWDPLGLGKLGEKIDTFPNMFPDKQYMQESEIKQGRMAMLAWTGIWATTEVSYDGPIIYQCQEYHLSFL
jgi:hypothetical protein